MVPSRPQPQCTTVVREGVDRHIDLQLWQGNKGSFRTRQATCSCPAYRAGSTTGCNHACDQLAFPQRTQAGMHARAAIGRGQRKCVQANFNSMHMHAIPSMGSYLACSLISVRALFSLANYHYSCVTTNRTALYM